MNFVRLRHEIIYMSRQLHYFQNVGDFAGDVVHGAAFQLLVDFTAKRQIVGHSAVRREKRAVGKDDFPAAQKFITEQCLVNIRAVKPDRRV